MCFVAFSFRLVTWSQTTFEHWRLGTCLFGLVSGHSPTREADMIPASTLWRKRSSRGCQSHPSSTSAEFCRQHFQPTCRLRWAVPLSHWITPRGSFHIHNACGPFHVGFSSKSALDLIHIQSSLFLPGASSSLRHCEGSLKCSGKRESCF